MAKDRLIVIAGPTAIGKTAVGIELAKLVNGEIISADSRQIYKHMNIGTAKPTIAEMSGVPHHLIDFLEPKEDFSAGEFGKRARAIAIEILDRGRQPIAVGGSGFYIKAMLEGLPKSPKMNEEKRADFIKKHDGFSNEKIFKLLSEKLPEYAKSVETNDRKKIIRALEIFEITGKMPEKKFEKWENSCVQLCLNLPREILYARINERTVKMIEKGLIIEVRSLLGMGIPSDCNAMNSVGYKEAIAFLQGEISENDMIEKIQKNTRNYAKRQMTWFRNQMNPILVEVEKKTPKEMASEIVIRLTNQHNR